MASDARLQVELVAADRVVWSGQAEQVTARTIEGDLGVLVDHAPLLSVLVPGVVRIVSGDEVVVAVVEDGFLSVADNRVSILAEDTHLAEELSREAVKAELDRARAEGDADAIAVAEAKLRGTELV